MEKQSWVKDITAFSSEQGYLPHLEKPGHQYFTASNVLHRKELEPADRDIVLGAILFHNEVKYELDAAVVMPDHFHMIFSPLPKIGEAFFGLREIFHSIKSFSANQIHKRTRERGALWQDEYYDHIIRNEKDYFEKLKYLLYNPVDAGLVDDPRQYKWLWYREWQ